MGALQLIVPNADFSGVGYGKFVPIPNPDSSLFAAYFLGTSYGGNPLADVSGNGRALTETGITFGLISALCSTSAYLTCPFKGADLVAARGTGTMVCVAKSLATRDDYLMGDFQTSNSVSSISLIAQHTNPISSFEDDQNGIYTAQVGGSTQDSARGTRYEMYAATFTKTQTGAYRAWGDPGSVPSQYVSQAASITNLGSSSYPITLGSGPTAPYSSASAPEMVAALFYAEALTQAQLDTVRIGLRTLLAGYGVTV